MYKFSKFTFFILLVVAFAFKATAQTQTAEVTDKNIKFLSYLPQGYDSKSEHPLMIFLHGLGEKGDDLNYVKRHGPPKLIDQGNWPSERPFIVISPQLPGHHGNWPSSLVNDVVNYVVEKYKVDEKRIYVTGLSLGGNGAWEYATNYPERVAATVPICGWGSPWKACDMKDVPAWAFHGDPDHTVDLSGSINMVNGINACSPAPKVPAKLTTYPHVGHDSWTRTYDLSAGHDIYSWMLSFTSDRGNSNASPTVTVGEDKSIKLPENAITLKGNASDADGSIASYQWTKENGPGADLSGTTGSELKVTNMVEGTYSFKLTVKDNDGASASDQVQVVVNPADNKTPTVSAGEDKSITLPENSVNIKGNASDADGSIASYQWTKENGPGADLSGTTGSELKITNMVEGTYSFKLTVKDNDGASASDQVQVVVNPADNKAPTVSAGEDKSITLPENSVNIKGNASDADGSIASYQWIKENGPDADLSGTTGSELKITNMVEGTYSFKLTVKDNDGASASDQVQVVVNPADNKAPTVSAGEDKSISLPENSVNIKGNASDADGSIASYQWTKENGPDADLSGTTGSELKVTNMVEGTYSFKLTVKDNDGASASDQVQVKVNPNKVPTVNAGEDQLITLPENEITLKGQASDADGSIASYKWTKTDGPEVSMSGSDQATVSVSEMPKGSYTFRLTVTDNGGASAYDEVKVKVNNPPTANAGPDKNLTLPTHSVLLSGGGADTDGTITSYEWSKISGGSVNMENTRTHLLSLSQLEEGQYKFQLMVKDNNGASAKDEVVVTVNPANNIAPVADAGKDVTIQLPENSVTLSGSGTDEDGTIVRYSWSQVSGDPLLLDNTNSKDLILKGLKEGTYELQLQVTDNLGETAKDQVKVTVLREIIEEPLVVHIAKQDASCFGAQDGSAEASVTGGTPPYSYRWSNGVEDAKNALIGKGTYQLKVKDATGKEETAIVDIHEPDNISITASLTDEIAGKGLGAIKLNVAGGTPPYQFRWYVDNETVPVSQDLNLTNVRANNYAIVVSDANGCTAEKTYNLKKLGKNNVSVFPNPSEGSVNIAIDASGGGYLLSIFNSQGKLIHKESGRQTDATVSSTKTFDLSSYGKGIYFVKVAYELGAFSTSRVIIE